MLEEAHGIVKDQSFCSCDDHPCSMALEVQRQRALLNGEPIVFVPSEGAMLRGQAPLSAIDSGTERGNVEIRDDAWTKGTP
jgi:hypothetical protein